LVNPAGRCRYQENRCLTENEQPDKKIRPDRNPARIKIQYPMKNHLLNADF